MNRSRRCSPVTLAFTILLHLAVASTVTVFGQESPMSSRAERGLEGTWRVEVTVVDCATGSERPPFWSLVTFERGGTVVDTTANQAFPDPRTPGHGVWHRTDHHGYSAATEAFILFGPTLRPWIHRIDQAIELTSSDTFVSHATVSFALGPGPLPAPAVPLPTGPICASARGFRF